MHRATDERFLAALEMTVGTNVAWRGNAARRRAGFTLLELLVAMSIAAVIAGSLYAALRIGFRAESSAESAVEPARTAELAMGLLRPDFESAVAPTGVLGGAFTGTDTAGDGGLPADSLQFYTLGDPMEFGLQSPTASGAAPGASRGLPGMMPTRQSSVQSSSLTGAFLDYAPGSGEVRQVTLFLRPSATGNVLVRQVTTNLLSQVTPDPYEEVVCRGVRSFNLRYFDGTGWQQSWDSTLLENNCPTAVEVTLELVRGEGEQAHVIRFVRVFLLSCSGLWSDTTAAASGGTQ